MNWADIILLALAAAIYPVLLMIVVLILTRPHPLRLLIGFLVGGMAVSIGAGIGILKVFESTGVVSKPSHSSRLSFDIVRILVGVLSLLIAWGLWRDPWQVWSNHVKGLWRNQIRGYFVGRGRSDPTQAKKPRLEIRLLSRGRVAVAVLAGMLLNLPGPWYLAALFEIAHANPSTASALAAIVLFNLIMFALAEVPIVVYLVKPQRAAGLANDLSRWSRQNSRRIGIAVAAVVGVVLVVRGAVNLS